MGLFDRFKRKPPSVPSEPQTADQLLATLFGALNDPIRLRNLCRIHSAEIAAHAASWQTIPSEIRGDPKHADAHIQRLIALADFLDRNGSPALMRQLQGPQDNPLHRIQAQIRRSRELADEFQSDQAVTLLTDLLIETRDLLMGGGHSPRGMIHGQLGNILFSSGRPSESLPHFSQALALCTEQNDLEGVRAYHAALYENHRYLNNPRDASRHADALADLYEASGEAARAHRHRRRARMASAGEPLNRIVAAIGDDQVELDELIIPADGRLKFVFARNRIPLGQSEKRVERAGTAQAADKDDEALDELRQGARIDPFNPNPHYQMGLVLMKQQRFAQAVEAYEKTEELAPGWFHVRSDLWLAKQLELGHFEHSLFMGTWWLTDSGASPADKCKAASQMVARFPGVPLLHLLHGQALSALSASGDAVATLRAGLKADPEPDVHTRLLVQLVQHIRAREERQDLLNRAIELNGNLVASAMARVMLKAG